MLTRLDSFDLARVHGGAVRGGAAQNNAVPLNAINDLNRQLAAQQQQQQQSSDGVFRQLQQKVLADGFCMDNGQPAGCLDKAIGWK